MINFSPLSKWTLTLAVIFLLFMTALRFAFFFYFHPGEYSLSNTVSAFILGLRFDLRTTCIITLPLLLFGSMHITYKPGRKQLTSSSILLIISIVIFSVFALMIMKNNKAGSFNIIGLLLLGVFLLIILFRFKDLNPYRNTKAEKFWKNYLLVFCTLLTFFYALDFQHFDYLHQRLNASVLNYTQDAKISFNMVWQTYPVIKMLLGILITVFLFYFIIKKTFHSDRARKYIPSHSSAMINFLWIVFLMFGIFGRFSQYPLRWSDAFAFGDDFKANLSLNPFQSFFSSLQFRHSDYNEKKVREAYSLMSDYMGVMAKDSSSLNYLRTSQFPDSSKIKPNVVLIICESFSAYKSSMYGNPLNTTPYFNELSKKGVFFDRCFTPAYGTARGVWAVITGIPDVENPNTASRNPAIVDQHSIINDFDGYEKYYFLGGSTSWANIRGLLTNNISGLHLYEEGNYKAKAVDVWGISDKHLFLEANDILKLEKKPFFAVIQTSDNHRPYTIPAEDKSEFKMASYPVDTLKKYGFGSDDELNAFRYTDFCYAKFMEAVKKEPYFSNTIFVFVGDHGIRGDAGNMFPKCWTDFGITTQHVPLLFYSPALLKAKRESITCSQIDILPTVASIIHKPFYNLAMGKNIFDTNSGNKLKYPHNAFLFDPDVNQIGIITDKYCYIKNLITGKDDMASSINNVPLSNNESTKEERKQLKDLTLAWYETAKYMLAHNKKKLTINK